MRMPASFSGATPAAIFGPAIFGDAQALADLGFVVFLFDGRGNMGRSKTFRDLSYHNIGTGGFLEDHVAALKQLATTRPYLDLDRVGICGTSGGGFAAAHALTQYPDFYKVGVARAGNYENRWDPYFRRIQQNYLLEHLMHAELPDEPNVVPVGGYKE
jgi:dipeptidyl aminopeptidase/acylaminoacyl peptidase